MKCVRIDGAIMIGIPWNIEPTKNPAKVSFSEEYNTGGICGALGLLDQVADMAQMCTSGGRSSGGRGSGDKGTTWKLWRV